ncbi:hypothetical protein ACWF94_37060, partial [Streptomyces sp. NPDC055078]
PGPLPYALPHSWFPAAKRTLPTSFVRRRGLLRPARRRSGDHLRGDEWVGTSLCVGALLVAGALAATWLIRPERDATAFAAAHPPTGAETADPRRRRPVASADRARGRPARERPQRAPGRPPAAAVTERAIDA